MKSVIWRKWEDSTARNPETEKVVVRFFAAAADAAGQRRLEMHLPPGTIIGDLNARLSRQFPRLRPWLSVCLWAVNAEYATVWTVLADGDEVALIPPVSGGAGDGAGDGPAGLLRIRKDPLSLDEAYKLVAHAGAGAVVLFLGTVRDRTEGKETVALDYECYDGMAEKEMAKVAAETESRWPGTRLAIFHRVGHLEVGEISVIVAASSPHRPEAFAAARQAIDRLKETVPIWKRDIGPDGGAEWVHLQCCHGHAGERRSG